MMVLGVARAWSTSCKNYFVPLCTEGAQAALSCMPTPAGCCKAITTAAWGAGGGGAGPGGGGALGGGAGGPPGTPGGRFASPEELRLPSG